jgi:predicted DNA-binding protein YlxM (UPF0122 family)
VASITMSTPVTRGELREEIDRLDRRFEEFDRKLEALDHKFEVRLDLWGGALLERLQTEMARHTKAILEAMSTQISTFDDKYAGLIPRVTHLETAVFAGKPR